MRHKLDYVSIMTMRLRDIFDPAQSMGKTMAVIVIMTLRGIFDVLEEGTPYEQKAVRATYQPGGKAEFVRTRTSIRTLSFSGNR